MATKTSATTKKPRGLSLNIGLNSVSAAHYGGWSGPLAACEFDAKDMATLATGRGMKATTLLTKNATRAKTLAALRAASKALVKGDFFFLTYSGHGGTRARYDGGAAAGAAAALNARRARYETFHPRCAAVPR